MGTSRREPAGGDQPGDTALELVRSAERASALLDPARQRLMEALLASPDSAAGLARRLGEKRQTVNYHLRALEDASLVMLVEERRRGNCMERVLRPVAREFVLDPAALGALATSRPRTGDRFSATYLVASAARIIRDLADLLDRSARQQRRLATATIESEVRLASPADFARFTGDLGEAIARVVAKHRVPEGSGRPLRIVAAIYPTAERQPDTDADAPGAATDRQSS